jgi:hypothetical protein
MAKLSYQKSICLTNGIRGGGRNVQHRKYISAGIPLPRNLLNMKADIQV